jgi:hypothetical protein
MNSLGFLLGGLTLYLAPGSEHERPEFPFSSLEKRTLGNRIKEYSEQKHSEFDYWHGGTGIDYARQHVPAKALTLEGCRVGIHADDEQESKTVRHLLRRLQAPLPVQPTTQVTSFSFADKATVNLLNQLVDPTLVSISLEALNSRFLIVSRDVPVYFLGMCSDVSMYLLWSNDPDLDTRIRGHYDKRFYFYRMQPLVNQICVIQQRNLRKKLNTLMQSLPCRLKLMNALEQHISRRPTEEEDTTV